SFETRYHGYSFVGDVDPRATNTPFNINSASRLSRYPQITSDPDFPYVNRIAGDAEYRLNIGANPTFSVRSPVRPPPDRYLPPDAIATPPSGAFLRMMLMTPAMASVPY